MGQVTLIGSDDSYAFDIDDSSRVVGAAGRGNEHHAVVWQDGRMIDLSTLGGPSEALATNRRGQIAGISSLGPLDVGPNHAVLWEDG
ncbi:MAG TPA: hypothetical protein VIL95_07960 [Bacillota bacterium]